MLLDRVLGAHTVGLSAPPRRARLKAPLGYHFLAAGHDGRHAVTVNGRIQRTTCWVPLEKVQSIRRLQGPVQRRLQLSSVHLDTAGRSVRAVLRDRDPAESEALVEELSGLCRQARSEADQLSSRATTMPAASSSSIRSVGISNSGSAGSS